MKRKVRMGSKRLDMLLMVCLVQWIRNLWAGYADPFMVGKSFLDACDWHGYDLRDIDIACQTRICTHRPKRPYPTYGLQPESNLEFMPLDD